MTPLGGVRSAWLSIIEEHRSSPAAPDDEWFWARRLDTASQDELRAIQDAKLGAALRYAYDAMPLFRHKLDAAGVAPDGIRTIDDLHHVPVTTKQDMVEDLRQTPPWGTFTAVTDELWHERGWQTFLTSGTTGLPRSFRYTSYDRELWSWANARAMWAMGFRPGRDVALIAFGYGPHVWLWGVHYALNLMGVPIVTAGAVDSSMRARFIDTYEPTILACTPTYALFLANVMTEMGMDPSASSIRYLFCAGEPGFSVPATRARLEQVWGAELHEFYGCTEAAPSAGGYTCAAVAADKDAQVSTHLMEDLQYWEVVEPTTFEPVPEGQRGISVVTNLASEGSPQIRFVVGDYTTLTREPCQCGRTHARAVGGFLGRADDMLNIRGVTLFPSSVEDAVRRVPGVGDEFLIVVSREEELDVLVIQVEAGRHDPAGYGELASRVEQEVRSRCELRPNVEIVDPGRLPRAEFKSKRVKDLR